MAFDHDPSRGKLEGKLDLDYGVRCHDRHLKYLGQVRSAHRFLQSLLAAGALAFGAQGKGVVAGALALSVVVIGEWIASYDVHERIAGHKLQRSRLLALRSREQQLTIHQIDAEIADIERDDPVHNATLSDIAYNDNLRRHGYKEEPGKPNPFAPETAWHTVMRFLS